FGGAVELLQTLRAGRDESAALSLNRWLDSPLRGNRTLSDGHRPPERRSWCCRLLFRLWNYSAPHWSSSSAHGGNYPDSVSSLRHDSRGSHCLRCIVDTFVPVSTLA